MAEEYIVEWNGTKQAIDAENLEQVWDAINQHLAGTDAERVDALITDPGGNTTYASNTQQWRRNDPAFFELFRRGDLAEEAMTDASQLAAPLEETSLPLRQERMLAANPIASRYASAFQGIPFVGEYGDEIVGSVMGDDTRDQMRAAQAAVADRRPGQALAGQLAMGIGTALPLAALGTAQRGASLLRTAVTGGGLGAIGGATEGAISGYGAGETPDERSMNARQRAMIGAPTGGALSFLAPFAGAGISRLLAVRPGQRVQQAAGQAGVSEDTMRATGQANNLMPLNAPEPTIPTSLAEASSPYRDILDTAMSVPNPAIDPTMGLLNRQAADASGRLVGTMDDLLGEPSGVKLQQRDLMTDTAERRAEVYDAAYQSPIDYSGEAGEQLQSLIATVDDDIISKANRLMARDGLRSAQMRVTLDDAGNVVDFENLPDVRQIDYITRALQSRASEAIRSGATEDVSTLTRQNRRIRETLDGLVPEYREARSQAAEIIGLREALDTGEDMLSPAMKREDVLMAVEDMTPGELSNVRSGLRQRIDDIMASASSTLDPDAAEYKEAMRALGSLTQRGNQDKMRMVMGDEAADALFAQLEEIMPTMITRMQGVGAGTRTAGRVLGTATIDDATGRVATGDTAGALRAAGQSILRYGAPTQAQARQSAASELAPLLAQQRTPQDFMRMQDLLAQTSRAMRRERDLASGGVRFGGVTGLAAAPAATRGAEQYLGTSPARGGQR